jgi:hypothetical protein
MPDRTVRSYLLGLAVLFAAAFLAGAFAPPPLRLCVAADFRSLLDPYRPLPGGDLFLLILISTTLVMLAALLLGVLLGVLPVLSVVSHGFLADLLCRQGNGGAGESPAPRAPPRDLRDPGTPARGGIRPVARGGRAAAGPREGGCRSRRPGEARRPAVLRGRFSPLRPRRGGRNGPDPHVKGRPIPSGQAPGSFRAALSKKTPAGPDAILVRTGESGS